MNIFLIKKMVYLANLLDSKGLYKEADVIDSIFINKYSAIVDVPSENLSNIFKPNSEDLKDEVMESVKWGIDEIKKYLNYNHPGVEVTDYKMVGASVTYQYTNQSDIDTTVFLNIPRSDPRFSIINDWVGENIDGVRMFGDRPFQFKISEDDSNTRRFENADAVYNPNSRTFEKKPELGKVRQEFSRLIEDEESAERTLYSSIEPKLQELAKLWASDARSALASSSVLNAQEKLRPKAEILEAELKKFKKSRSKSYTPEGWSGRISQNWGGSNIIWKFLEREGYITFLKLVKDAMAETDRQKIRSGIMASISTAEALAQGQIGYDPRGDDPLMGTTFHEGDVPQSIVEQRRIQHKSNIMPGL